jgi:hypothetical protein
VLELVLISISSFLGIDNGIADPVPVPFCGNRADGFGSSTDSLSRVWACGVVGLAEAENPDMAFHGYVCSTSAEE